MTQSDAWRMLQRRAQHDGFTDKEREDVQATYREIKAIYRTVKDACSGPDPQRHYTTLTKRFLAVSTIHDLDPKPVIRLKTTLRKNIARYL